jgi:hypothetical protein
MSFSITEDDTGVSRVYAALDLNGYNLPPSGRIWLEAYDRNAIMRFPFGIVEHPSADAPMTLDDFVGSDSYYFRVKVVDPQHQSKLLASADAISPVRHDGTDQPRKSLLRVTTRDLGPVPWSLEFPPGDYPLLVINNEIDAGKSLARSNHFFQALVFPAVLNQILRKILLEEEYRPGSDPDDDDRWKEAWLEFCGVLPGNSRLAPGRDFSEEDLDDWIENSIEAFCRKLGAVRKVRVDLKEIE